MTHTPLMFPSIDDTDADAHCLIPFSRSAGLLSSSGNADSELKTRVSDDVADDWRKMARSLGMTTSEFLRLTVMVRLYGVEGVSIMTAKHLALVAGQEPSGVPEKAQV